MGNQEVLEELDRWGAWYLETTGADGFRLDAVKHIRFTFFKDWLGKLRQRSGKPLFAVGEYWKNDVGTLLRYLDACGDCMSLFDVPLHFNFYNASHGGGGYDMRNILKGTLLEARPERAVTFVDNHDTQPGQALAQLGGWVVQVYRLCADPAAWGGTSLRLLRGLLRVPHDKINQVGGDLMTMLRVRSERRMGSGEIILTTPMSSGGRWREPRNIPTAGSR